MEAKTGEEARSPEFLRSSPVRLVALAIPTSIVLVEALRRYHVHSFVALAFAGPALLLIAALAFCLPRTAGSRLGVAARRIREIDFLWFAAVASFTVSFAAAQMAFTIQRQSYWPPFFLWIASLLLVIAAIVGPMLAPVLNRRDLRGLLAVHKWELLLIAMLTLTAAALRITNLSTIPSPFIGDEALLANQAVNVLHGVFKNMFGSDIQGHATMQYFAQAAFLKVLGVNVFSSRLISALAGTITVPLFYIFLRKMFGVIVAAVGACYLLAYHFAVHYSRVGMENIADPLLMVGTLYFVWRATRSGKSRDFALAGLVAGFGLYLSPAGRIVPVVAAAVIGYALIHRPSFIKQAAPGMLMMAGIYLVAAFPIAVHWLTHQSQFMARVNTIGIFQSGWLNERVQTTGEGELRVLWEQVTHSFGAFGYYGDRSQFYLAPATLVDRLSLLPFLIGIAYSIYRFWDERYALLLMVFVAVVGTGGVLTAAPPQSQRLLGTIPAVAAFVAIGVKLVADAASKWRRQAGPVFMGVAMVALVAVNIQYYFGTYRTGGYFGGAGDYISAQVVEYVKTLPKETRVFFYGHDRIYIGGYPAMVLPLRDYVRFDVLSDGRVVGPFTPSPTPAASRVAPAQQGEGTTEAPLSTATPTASRTVPAQQGAEVAGPVPPSSATPTPAAAVVPGLTATARQGTATPTPTPTHIPPIQPAVSIADTPSVFIFLPAAEQEIEPLIQSCPGGELKTFMSKGGREGVNGIVPPGVTFFAYELTVPNHCVPLTFGQQIPQ